ncbi:MAG: TIGR00266 family protein [Selenomonadaceae bacterium]|nr:TIGR00266 family protein [Selenomonadaceae bacterium]
MNKKYQILYPEAFPVVEYNLQQGERIKAESDAMIAMSSTIDVEGKMEGGILKGLMRKVVAGESFFFQELIASRGPGTVLFGHPLPGGILDVELDGSYGLVVQKDGFLAGTQDIQVDTKMQNLSKGLFSGEGFFILKITGRGTVFISSYGVIHPINLEAGQEFIIDNGHLVAWPDYMEYTIEKASQGWFSSLTSGEGLVCRFRGPGVVLIQTRNPSSFTEWIRSMIPAGSSK